MKAAVFCSKGLGDALIFLVIAQNLKNEGYEVDVYHEITVQLQPWFHHFFLRSYPKNDEIRKCLEAYDLIIINKDEREISQQIAEEAKELKPDNCWILCPTTCKGKKILGDFQFDIRKSMVENLQNFCRDKLACKNVVFLNGIFPLKELKYRQCPSRIIIHPTSTSKKRNWPKVKFLALAKILKNKGYTVAFIVSEQERSIWQDALNQGYLVPSFASLQDLAAYVYESGYMIGNDSGIGHLASCLKIPTLTIFASRRKRLLWQPGWFLNEKVAAPWWVINIKGFRLREKKWHVFISVGKLYNVFKKLVSKHEKMLHI